MIGWITARQDSLSPPLFWYPYFKADPPYVLTYARVEGEPLSSAVNADRKGERASPTFVEHVERVGLGYRLLRHLSPARWLSEHEFDPQLDILMALRLI